MVENTDADMTVEHEFNVIDVQMIIGLFAIGYGIRKWIGAGISLISTAIMLSIVLDSEEEQE